MGLIDEAIKEYHEALRLNPGLVDTRFNLGLTYKRKGLKNEAIREFERVLEIKPENVRARKILEGLLSENSPSSQ
jgi:tetratricopeptide (TPR) repeat protein